MDRLDAKDSRLWALLGPFEAPDEATRAATDAVAARADAEEPHGAELLAGSIPAGDGAEQGAAAYYRLWRVRFQEGGEARGSEIIRDRLIPAMMANDGQALLLRLSDGAWDLLAIDGPFATADEAQARIERRDTHFEDALNARIGDPRTVAATRSELGALIAAEEQRVVSLAAAP